MARGARFPEDDRVIFYTYSLNPETLSSDSSMLKLEGRIVKACINNRGVFYQVKLTRVYDLNSFLSPGDIFHHVKEERLIPVHFLSQLAEASE